MKLIDKDTVVAEIESYKNSFCDRNGYLEDRETSGLAYDTLCELEDSIDTLEVKEVDLYEEADNYWGTLASDVRNFIYLNDFYRIAKHFFELGVRVNNPITAADRGTAEEIIINLKRVEQDYHIDLTREIEWLSNKVQRGE